MKFQKLISTKYEEIQHFSGSDKPKMLFFLLIDVKMPTIVGILTFIRRKKFILSCVEHEKSLITSGPVCASAVILDLGFKPVQDDFHHTCMTLLG